MGKAVWRQLRTSKFCRYREHNARLVFFLNQQALSSAPNLIRNTIQSAHGAPQYTAGLPHPVMTTAHAPPLCR